MTASNPIDIDQIVDYRAEHTAVIEKYKITGDNLIGLCPFHRDKNNSFSVDLKTGKDRDGTEYLRMPYFSEDGRGCYPETVREERIPLDEGQQGQDLPLRRMAACRDQKSWLGHFGGG